MNLISVVIPTHNRAAILPKCIESVLNQTYKNYELIIVDNGSTDNTKEVISSYAKKDERVKYIYQENSGTPAGSRNTGIKNAKSEWVALLDSDDYWYENKLECVANAINEIKNLESSADSKQGLPFVMISNFEDKFVGKDFAYTITNGARIKNVANAYNELLFRGNDLSPSGITLKKEAALSVGCFDERVEYFAVEDYDLWLKLSKIGKVFVIEQSLGVYYINNQNVSGDIQKLNENLKCVLNNHIDSMQIDTNLKQKLKNQANARAEYYKARSYLLNARFKEARKCILDSLKLNPFFIKAWISLVFSAFHIKK